MSIEHPSFTSESSTHLSLVSQSFQLVQPTGVDFATRHITEALTWRDFAYDAKDFSAGYLVAFRSILKEGLDDNAMQKIQTYDSAAEYEAMKQPGFIGYFKGPLNVETRENLSLCIWRSREDARNASNQPAHRKATAIVNDMYESWDLERWELKKQLISDGPWIRFEQLLLS